MIENPLNLPPPGDPLDRVRAFARDLAYGAINNLWPASLRGFVGETGVAFAGNPDESDAQLAALIADKWQGNYPPLNLLQTFGYLSITQDGGRVVYFAVTHKAFDLLEKPAAPPKVFVSYGRKQSSAFALLVEARLNAIGIRAFVDRSIDPGEAWHKRLQESIRASDTFICLIAPGTLNSPYCREEIRWCVEHKITAVPVWHGGFSYNKAELSDLPPWLEQFVTSRHAIRVQEESAEGYHDAMEKLINRLGYARD